MILREDFSVLKSWVEYNDRERMVRERENCYSDAESELGREGIVPWKINKRYGLSHHHPMGFPSGFW